MRSYIYIDGFNLYYGAVKGTKYKWLDVSKMCRVLLPKSRISKFKYFTARVSSRPEDPGKPTRQQFFLRALRTIPDLEIIFGRFFEHEVSMLRAGRSAGKGNFVRVIKTEEKGSDVNIASHLINDGHKGLYDLAILVTNDSDLVEPIRIVRQELKLKVGILNPHRKPAFALQKTADFIRPIRKGVLAASQFPNLLVDEQGQFHKPPSWA